MSLMCRFPDMEQVQDLIRRLDTGCRRDVQSTTGGRPVQVGEGEKRTMETSAVLDRIGELIAQLKGYAALSYRRSCISHPCRPR